MRVSAFSKVKMLARSYMRVPSSEVESFGRRVKGTRERTYDDVILSDLRNPKKLLAVMQHHHEELLELLWLGDVRREACVHVVLELGTAPLCNALSYLPPVRGLGRCEVSVELPLQSLHLVAAHP